MLIFFITLFISINYKLQGLKKKHYRAQFCIHIEINVYKIYVTWFCKHKVKLDIIQSSFEVESPRISCKDKVN